VLQQYVGNRWRAHGDIGNPTKLAIIRAAYFSGVNIDGLKSAAPQIAEVPFSSEYKFMATIHEPVQGVDSHVGAGDLVVHVKGAPDRVVATCKTQAVAGAVDSEEAINKKYWLEQLSILSLYGLRVLALCRGGTVPKTSVQNSASLNADFVRKGGEPWLTMVGLCAIIDPPCPECVDAIKITHKAGVCVASMITGDHKDTALDIGDMLGLVNETYNSPP
jgi:magnesium-transporting ATPase (P-type)